MTKDDHDPAERWYQIAFGGDVTELIHQITPTVEVLAVPTHTILSQRVQHRMELDRLMDSLSAMGITPDEVYESAAMPQRSRYCEVRIRGCLGDAILHYLRWSHRVVQTTVVALHASQESLRSSLDQLAAVTSVDYVLAR